MIDLAAEIRFQVFLVHQSLEQQFRIDVRRSDFCTDLPSVFQFYATGPIIFYDYFLDRRADFNLYALCLGRLCHRLGDAAHPARNMPPAPFLPVHLTKHVVQQHVGRTAGVNRLHVTHHGDITLQRQYQVPAEPLFQVIPHTHGKQLDRFPLQSRVQAPHPVGQFPGAPQVR